MNDSRWDFWPVDWGPIGVESLGEQTCVVLAALKFPAIQVLVKS